MMVVGKATLSSVLQHISPRLVNSQGPVVSKMKMRRRPSESTAKTVDIDISDHSPCCHEVTMPAKKKKTVSFSSTTKCRFTISLDQFSEEEMQATWYCTQEYSEITRQCCKEVARIERGEILKDMKYCSRGLEKHCFRAAQLVNKNREAVYIAVLDERMRNDDQWVVEKYNSISSSCQLWANVAGLQDQKDAEGYLFDDL